MDKQAIFESVRLEADSKFSSLTRQWKEMLETQQMIEGDREGKKRAFRRVAQAIADVIVASLGTHTFEVTLIGEFVDFLGEHYLAQREVLSPVADDVMAQLEAFGRNEEHDETERNLANAYRDQVKRITEGAYQEDEVEMAA